MIRLDKLRPFPFKTSEIYWPGNMSTETPLNFVFFPENANFNMAYRKLRIPRRFVKHGTIVPSIVPRLIYTRDLVSQYLLFKLIPVRNITPAIKNLFIDTTPFLTKLDERYQKGNYRRPQILTKINNYLNQPNTMESLVGRKNVLIYYVDLTQPIPFGPVNKRGWTVINMFKTGNFMNYDYILLSVWNGRKILYYLLKGNDFELSWTRVFNIIGNMKQRITVEDIENNTEELTNDIIVTSDINEVINGQQDNSNERAQVKEVIPNETPDTVVDVDQYKATGKDNERTKKAVKRYLQSRPTLNSILKKQPVTPYTARKVVLTSVMARNLRNDDLVINAVKKINPQDYLQTINSLKKDVVPNLLRHDDYENESRQLVFDKAGINAINDHKNPSAVLNKRKADFQKFFTRDLVNSFMLLSKNTNYPLKLKHIEYSSVPIEPGDLEPSKFGKYRIILEDDQKKFHEVNIEIPEIQKDGTFLINGSRKYMMYQNVIDPIFFMKKGQGTLQTMYAPVTVFLKETKYKSYFTCHIAGYHVPLALLLIYSIGLDKTGKLFGFGYKVTETSNKNKDNKYYSIDFADGKSIEFNILDTNRQFVLPLLDSLKEYVNSNKTSALDLFDHIKTSELLITAAGNRNSIFRIDQVLKNIMEPIAVEVLKSKMYPTEFNECIKYICMNIGMGRVDARNDISKQRIRCSEVMTYQIQKQILASYSQYLTDREHGNKDAKFYCDTRNIVKSIINSSTSKLMRDLDNINPYDELSCLTQISPVGDGGVANADGITKEGRNINDSYYGNIDSMDTPENGNIGINNHLTIDAAIGNVKGSFGKVNPKNDIGVGCLGVCSAVVPFVNHNDGCRVMFSGSQGRQAIPIIGNQKPLVQTGYETIMTSMLGESYVKKSYSDGIVTNITNNAIYVKDNDGSTQKVVMDNPVLKTSIGQIKGSLNSFHPVVKIGQRVKDGQILAEGKHIKDGVISVGTNLLVGMMGWKGYSFEDGYIVSESVANKTLTSMSYEEKEVLINKDDNVKFIAESGKFTKSGDTLLIRSSKNVEAILGMDSDEIVEGQQIIKSSGGRILSIEIYPNISIKKFPVLIPEFEKFKARYEEANGSFPSKFFNSASDSGVPFSGIKIVFKIERYDTCILGDKITNNHGGKGTITYIEADKNMPITPWGERLDILFNPIAVINRMNPGTTYEMYSGLIAKTLARRIVNMGFTKTQKAIDLVTAVYQSMDRTPNKVLSSNIIKAFSNLNNKQYTEFINSVIDDGYVMPIYAPQFKEPTKEMIRDTLKLLSLKEKYYLELPEWHCKTLEPVAVGYLYYKKLEQQAAYKQSVRSTGKYNSTTGQATAGKAQGGGQRVGEMDSYAIISHGAINVLRELFGPLSDDKKTKDEIISDIINNGSAAYREPRNSGTTNRMKVFMTGMMIQNDLD